MLSAYRPPLLAAWGKNDPFFLGLAPKPFSAMIGTPKSTCSTPAISRWRVKGKRPPGLSAGSLDVR